MSKPRKKNSAHRRAVTFGRAMLRQHHVAVVDIDTANTQIQTLINYKTGGAISNTGRERRAIVDLTCDIPHRWTLYIAALCQQADGSRYMKSVELTTNHYHVASELQAAIEPYAARAIAQANPMHFKGLAWLAIPHEAELSEQHLFNLFETAGAWLTTNAA